MPLSAAERNIMKLIIASNNKHKIYVLPDRHMIFRGDYASEGCIPQERFEGVLKVTLLVFNVAKDNTHYTLTVSGK